MSTLTERVVAIADTHTVALFDGHWPCRACEFSTEEVEGRAAFRAHVADAIIAEVREQVAQDILDEAENYAGDAAREFGEIFAKVARGGEGK